MTVPHEGNKMTKTIIDLSEENLDDMPKQCKSCSYWEVGETKERWLIETLRFFDCRGQFLKLDEETIGYAQYGPLERFPKIGEYSSVPL